MLCGKYDKEFKKEAVKLSDEVGIKQAAAQLGVLTTRCQNGAINARHTEIGLLWEAVFTAMRL